MKNSPSPSANNDWIANEDTFLDLLREATGTGQRQPEVPGYRLIREIASGAQGSVFEAVRSTDDARVAVKILARQTFPTSKAALRLKRELELVQRLDHPGIVRVLESGFTETSQPFLAMELLPGNTLCDAIPLGLADGPFQNLPDALNAFLEICAAIDHAHKRGVLHRDLKPSNILFDENRKLHVADFGIAKDLSEQPSSSKNKSAFLTQTGDLLGSLAYAAPEQLTLGPSDVDVRSDVYALGVILYQLLTGTLPVSADGNLLEVLQRLQDHRPQLPSRALHAQFTAGTSAPGAPAHLPRDLDAVVLMALARDKKDRYQSVAELAADVRCVLKDQPVRARHEGNVAALWRWIRNHRLAASSFLITVTALLAVTVQSLERAQERDRMNAWALDSQSLLLNDALRSIGRLAGGGASREHLIRATLGSFERILVDFPEDPDLLAGKARAAVLLGQQLREQGNPTAAMASYQEALQDYRGLCARTSPDPIWQHGLSLTLVKIGDLKKEAGHMPEAMDLYHEALALDQMLAASNPRNPLLLDNLFWSWQRLGSLALDVDDFPLARNYLDHLPALAENLIALAPNQSGARLARAAIHKANAAYETRRGNISQATLHLQHAVQAYRDNLSTDPDGVDSQAQLAWALYGISSLELIAGRVEEAHAQVQEAISRADALVAAEPQAVDLLHLQTILRLRFLDIEIRRGNSTDALAHAQDSLATMSDKAIDRSDLLISYIHSTLSIVESLNLNGNQVAAIDIALTSLEIIPKHKGFPDPWRSKISKRVQLCEELLGTITSTGDVSPAKLSELNGRLHQVRTKV